MTALGYLKAISETLSTNWSRTGGLRVTMTPTVSSIVAPLTNTELRASPIKVSDYDLDIARGLVSGVSQFSKFGYNKDIDNGAPETVWSYSGGLWTPQAVARTLSVVSSDVADKGTATAGTGARTVTIIGVNASRASQTETVTLNGTNAVTTSGTWLGVNRMVVTTAGTSTTNVGDITATSTTDGLVQGFIAAGDGITNQLIYHVPTGFTAYVRKIIVGVNKIGAGTPEVQVRGYMVSGGVRIQTYYDQLTGDSDPFRSTDLVNPVALPAGSYFWVDAETSTNNTSVRARVEMTLVAT